MLQITPDDIPGVHSIVAFLDGDLMISHEESQHGIRPASLKMAIQYIKSELLEAVRDLYDASPEKAAEWYDEFEPRVPVLDGERKPIRVEEWEKRFEQ
jgi:hypothetical protein